MNGGAMDGVVLAGGPGNRLGVAKAGIRFGTLTLVERAVAILEPHCRRVIVVSRPGIRLPALPARVIFDRPGPDAPLTAVATGLAATDAAQCLVLACDLPFAAPVVDRLSAHPAGRACVARDPAGRDQPLCGRYPRASTLAVCESLLDQGELRLGRMLERIEPYAVQASTDELLNVNTPGDLEHAERLARGGWRDTPG